MMRSLARAIRFAIPLALLLYLTAMAGSFALKELADPSSPPLIRLIITATTASFAIITLLYCVVVFRIWRDERVRKGSGPPATRRPKP